MPEARKYETMKDSGAEWVGLIPQEWTVGCISDLYVLRNEKVSDKDYPPLSVTMKGIVPQLATAAKTDDGDNRKLVRVGDFAINSRSDRRGSCGVSPYDGSVSLINTILTPRGEMHPGYYNWLFHTVQFADEFYKWGHGIVDDLWTTRWQEMKRIVVPTPPYPVQENISAYLDAVCADIDTAIAEAKASIEDYKLLKQSIITRAVIKGLDPDVEMKDSGIAWIGAYPKTWHIEKVRWNFSVELGKMLDASRITGKSLHPYLRNADVQWGKINYDNLNEMDFSDDEIERYSVRAGDLMVCEGGDIGKSAIVGADVPPDMFYQKALHRVRKRKGRAVSIEYLFYVLFAMSKGNAFLSAQEKATIAHLPAETFNQVRIPIPGEADQKAIAEYLCEKCELVDSLINEKNGLISDLEVYKRSLIYEVVTGKRKVV